MEVSKRLWGFLEGGLNDLRGLKFGLMMYMLGLIQSFYLSFLALNTFLKITSYL